MATTRNEVTGDRIRTKATSQAFRDNFDLLKPSKPLTEDQKPLTDPSKTFVRGYN